MKNPTLREKVAQYESYLHKINMFIVSCNNDGIAELVRNADVWSYAHRISNGEFSDRQQQQAINDAFLKLSDTPEADKASAERQRKYTEALKKEGKKKLF